MASILISAEKSVSQKKETMLLVSGGSSKPVTGSYCSGTPVRNKERRRREIQIPFFSLFSAFLNVNRVK